MAIRFKPTKTGYFVLFLLFLFYIFSALSQTGLLYIFIGIIASAFFINVIYSIKGIKALNIDEIDKLITTEDKPVETKIEIRNKSKKNICFTSLKSNFGTLFNINEVPALSTKHVTPEIIFKRRGIYNLNKLKLETVNPFGLFLAGKSIKCSGKIKVYPKLYQCPAPPASGFEPMLGGHYKGHHTSLFGEDFAGVRPYVEGYPVKFIHWKASSKGMGIFVKEFNEEFSGKISFVFQNKDFFKSKENNILDWNVRAMGSLAFAALDIGHSIEISDFAGKQNFKASPFTNNTELLEFLTRIEGDKENIHNADLSNTIDALPKKSSLAFILTEPNKKCYDTIAPHCNSGRKVSIYLPFIESDDLKLFLNLTSRIYYYNEGKIWKI